MRLAQIALALFVLAAPRFCRANPIVDPDWRHCGELVDSLARRSDSTLEIRLIRCLGLYHVNGLGPAAERLAGLPQLERIIAQAVGPPFVPDLDLIELWRPRSTESGRRLVADRLLEWLAPETSTPPSRSDRFAGYHDPRNGRMAAAQILADLGDVRAIPLLDSLANMPAPPLVRYEWRKSVRRQNALTLESDDGYRMRLAQARIALLDPSKLGVVGVDGARLRMNRAVTDVVIASVGPSESPPEKEVLRKVDASDLTPLWSALEQGSASESTAPDLLAIRCLRIQTEDGISAEFALAQRDTILYCDDTQVSVVNAANWLRWERTHGFGRWVRIQDRKAYDELLHLLSTDPPARPAARAAEGR